MKAVVARNGKDGAFVTASNLSYRLDAPPIEGRAAYRIYETLRRKLITDPLHKPMGKSVLSNVSFYLKPGTMTLILGPPGGGKTSLFNILCNRVKSGQVSGEVLFNGKEINPLNHNRMVSFVNQLDIHLAPLTLKQTLMFSAQCQMPEDTTYEEKEKRVDCVMRMLGVKHREDVIVGDQVLRGISGGEKRRTSIGIEAVKAPTLICMDEPTTGLDSQAAYEILHRVQTLAKVGGIPVLTSLLQPSYELASLFDNLMILAEGEIVYFGPFQEALAYFDALGFAPREDENPADFLQNVVQTPHLFLKEGSQLTVRTVTQFREKFKKSHYYQECQDIIAQPIRETRRDWGDAPTYPTTLIQQIKLCLRREMIMKVYDPAPTRTRVLKSIIIAFILGTLYFNLGHSQQDSVNKMGLMFFGVSATCMGAMVTLPPLLKARSVFYEQKAGKYYKPMAYFLAVTLSEIPLAVFESTAFITLIYWMANLKNDADAFFFYLFTTILLNFTTLSYCRFVSSIVPTFALAVGVTPATVSVFLLFGGYMIPPGSMPSFWLWLYWISPARYAFEAYAITEFQGSDLTCDEDELVPSSDDPITWEPCPYGFNGTQSCAFTSGDDLLEFYDMSSDGGWRYVLILILAIEFAVILFCNILSLEFVEFAAVKPDAVTTTLAEEEEKRLKSRGGRSLALSYDVLPDSDAGLETQTLVRQSKSYSERVNELRNRKIVGASLYFRNLCYTVPIIQKGEKKEILLLDHVSGGVKPGHMLALMGASGAGKSTLMDVLADRKTAGWARGEININGEPRNSTFKQFTGYVEQQDIHIVTQTVREALEFSAVLRLPSTWPIPDKMDFAHYVLEMLDLTSIGELQIGVAGGGISVEQRKRLTIGVELAANPTLIFLDEPTSGLDSAGADKVMESVKRIADSGRSIICTIHQPSKKIFGLFTDLLLLKTGGQVVYFGPMGENYSAVLDYFAALGYTTTPDRNPADYILEISGGTLGSETSSGADPAQQYLASELYQSNKKDVEEGMLLKGEENTFPGQYATDFVLQFKMNMQRSWKSQIRRWNLARTKFARSLVVSILVGTVFYQQPHTQIGAQNRVALCFFGTLFCALNAVSQIPIIIEDRAAYYREHASGTYRSFAYLASIILAEFPITIFASILWTTPVYWLAGMAPDFGKFVFWFCTLTLTSLAFNSWCQCCACAAPSSEVATATSTGAVTLFTMFAGFMIPKNSIPDYWIWVYHISIPRYSVEATTVNELADTEFYCTDDELTSIYACGEEKEACQYTNGNQVLETFDMEKDMKYWDLLILFFFTCFLVGLTHLALRYLRVIKR
eukprot:TRINITY_DN1723_c0_g2_i3.p1 TRINITY_DN1723_c0_g2~~TRINITY_DN1723_c0_g2_i3.p1  ORF type:complete len:1322 (-),score=259.68 TRINITY_DN1723_c0_g2_i3:116-4081(-)